MATEIFFTRTLDGRLIPSDAESQEAVYEMKMGVKYRADVVIPRNQKRLDWWWKLAEIIRDNSEHWPSKECASDMLKLKCGHFRTVIVPGKNPGDWVPQYQAKSIAFGNMKEPEFKALCSKAVQVASEVLSCESDQLHEALNDFFAGRKAA